MAFGFINACPVKGRYFSSAVGPKGRQATRHLCCSFFEFDPGMRNWFKWLWIPVAILLLPAASAYGIDKLWLASGLASHTAITRELPFFDLSREGLVRIRASGMEFRARVGGFDNPNGEGVILLHGFPETSIMWEPLLDRLAKAGFRVVAFDQRGYSPGARPFRVKSYSAGRLASDVMAVAGAVGFERFHVVGHDFGGAIAWIVADRFPQEVLSLTALSMPHPAALAEALGDPDAQWLHSSYVLMHWVPLVPELVFGFDRAAYLRNLKWQMHAPEQVKEYTQVFSEFGALRGALNWYRAFQFEPRDPLRKIRQPTLFMWGNEDQAFSRLAAETTANHVEGPFRFHRLKAGHTLMLDLPDRISDEVLAHLKSASQVAGQWRSMQAAGAQQDANCAKAKPHCLRIFAAPDGRSFRIRNRCDEAYRGAVRVSCTAWPQDAFMEYRFDLGPGADMIQESNGFASGDCYYSQRLCDAGLRSNSPGRLAVGR